MGGIKSRDCDEITFEIWNWCLDRKIFISAEHLPGLLNTTADRLSRKNSMMALSGNSIKIFSLQFAKNSVILQ